LLILLAAQSGDCAHAQNDQFSRSAFPARLTLCAARLLRRVANTAIPVPKWQRGRVQRMIPLLKFIAMVISLYIWVIIISAILSWLIAFDVVNRRNRAVYMIADSFNKLTEPALRPIRNVLPDFGGLDISPVILILALIFVRDVVLFGWLA
jgi:YggT family protein